MTLILVADEKVSWLAYWLPGYWRVPAERSDRGIVRVTEAELAQQPMQKGITVWPEGVILSIDPASSDITGNYGAVV